MTEETHTPEPVMHSCGINQGIAFFLSPNCPECKVVAAAHTLKEALEKLAQTQHGLSSDGEHIYHESFKTCQEDPCEKASAALALTEKRVE